MKEESLAGKSLLDKVIIIINENPKKAFHPKELAEIISKRDPKYFEKKKKQKGSAEKALKQISSEISSLRKKLELTVFMKVTESPDGLLISYFASESGSEVVTKNYKPSEEELYEILRLYLKSIDIYSMRIDERVSSNNRSSKGNHWLHPDIVGIEVLGKGWSRAVKDCVKAYHGKKVRLWSFEVKKDMNKLREYYQQAVSNSSWANFGYLVVPEIKPEIKPRDKEELNILSSLHGIGFIELNVEEPQKSQIIIPAKERPEIDWNIVNRIAEQNKPFEEHYVEQIQAIHDTTTRIKWNSSPWTLKAYLLSADMRRIFRNISSNIEKVKRKK